LNWSSDSLPALALRSSFFVPEPYKSQCRIKANVDIPQNIKQAPNGHRQNRIHEQHRQRRAQKRQRMYPPHPFEPPPSAPLQEGVIPAQSGLDVAVEIVSDEKNLADIKRKSRKYDEWGFGAVYIVDPRNRSVYLWRNDMATPVTDLASIPCLKIWEELDRLCEE